MFEHRGLVACILVALAGCGQDSAPGGATSSHESLGTVPKRIETETREKVDAAVAAGKAATDEAIEAATGGKPPARGDGY